MNKRLLIPRLGLIVECYIVKDGVCVAKKRLDVPI